MTAETPSPLPSQQTLKLNHHEARERWGLPDESLGNVNDPRTREEHGVRYNEKWIYFLSDGGKRLVYWFRYDCRGLLIEAADGTVEAEPL